MLRVAVVPLGFGAPRATDIGWGAQDKAAWAVTIIPCLNVECSRSCGQFVVSGDSAFPVAPRGVAPVADIPFEAAGRGPDRARLSLRGKHLIRTSR